MLRLYFRALRLGKVMISITFVVLFWLSYMYSLPCSL